MSAPLGRRLAAEAIGTSALLAVVIGSGIMGERLSGGNVAIALLANSFATGCGLVALIVALGPVSAHFNPAVTLVEAVEGGVAWGDVLPYVAVQVLGAIGGVVTAHLMFAEPIVSLSSKPRTGPSQWFAEMVATFGLVLVVRCCSRAPTASVAYAVGAYVAAAYWFTASTSFANPAVTLARALSDTFAGIQPAHVPAFVASQLAGAVLGAIAARAIRPAA